MPSILTAAVNREPDTALRFLVRVKHRLLPSRDLETPLVPLEIPPELDAFLESAHDLKCPITMDILVDPCILDGKVSPDAWCHFLKLVVVLFCGACQG